MLPALHIIVLAPCATFFFIPEKPESPGICLVLLGSLRKSIKTKINNNKKQLSFSSQFFFFPFLFSLV